MKTAILIGATGLIGSHLLDKLLQVKEYSKLLVFVRRSTNIRHTKLEEHIIDFDKPDMYADKIQGEDLFCCFGTTIKQAGSQEDFTKIDMEYPLQFAKIALKNGAQNFSIVSSIGANADSSNFYLRTKGKCEDLIRQIPFTSISIFRPSFLLGKKPEFRLGKRIAMILAKIFSFLLFGKFRRYRAIEADQVAKAMLDVMHEPVPGVKIYESDEIQNI